MEISVVICTFNGENYIADQLTSILHQTRSVDEIIVMDDGSSDHTVEQAKKVLESGGIPYRIVCNHTNLGVALNFEKGIRLADGDIVLTSDQDDIWMENKVQMFEQTFENSSDCVLAFSDGKVTDSNLDVTRESIWEASGFTEKKQSIFESGNYYDILFSDNVVTGAAMGVRKDFAKKCPSAPEGTLHDYWYALCAPFFGEMLLIKESCILYRQHGKNVMGVPNSSFSGKVKRWFAAARLMEKDRIFRADRAKALANFTRQLQDEHSLCEDRPEEHFDYEKQVCKWKEFCSWRETLTDSHGISAIFQILKHAINGEYKKYADKTGIVFQDMLACLSGTEKEVP